MLLSEKDWLKLLWEVEIMPNGNHHNITGVEQGRANFAYEKVRNFYQQHQNNEKFRKEYRSYVKKIPMLIKTNGLGSAYAFVLSKRNSDAWGALYNQTKEWLSIEPKQLIRERLQNNNNTLIDVLVSINSPLYRAVTVEVLTLFNWMRRFAEGLFEGGNQGGNG